MKIAEIEAALIGQIKEALPKFHVDTFPENLNDPLIANPNGVVFVRYDGSQYTGHDSQQTVGRMVTLECIVIHRSLRTKDAKTGIYDMLDIILATVSRGRLGGIRWVPIDDGFLSEVNGVWQYGIRFQGKTIYQLGT